MRVAMAWSVKNDDRHAVFARDVHRFNGRVKTVFDIRRRNHHARGIAVAAEAGDVQIGLFDVGRHARGRAAALDVHDDQRHFRHDRPAERLGLERNARTAGAGDRHPAAVTRADGHRDRGDFVFRLHKRAAVFGQFAPQQFHDVRPRRDGITRAETHARRQQTVAQRFVAVHHDLVPAFVLAFHELEGLQHVAQRMAVTGMERRQRVVQNARIFAGETFADQLFQLGHIQIKHLGHEAERVNIFALVLGRAADGFHHQAGDRHADMMIILLPFGLRLDVVRIIQDDAALFQRS